MPEPTRLEIASVPESGILVGSRRRARLLALAWFTAIYAPATVLVASRRLFWNDELFTYHVSNQPGMEGIWHALTTGADAMPPLFYWITRLAMTLPGNPRVLMRLPAIAGFWLMGACLAAFVWRRLPVSYGLLAAFLALPTGAYMYAYEARPYGIVVGLGALALVCWQRADDPPRLLWSGGLAASMALAVSMHYYAVLLMVPLAGAEAVYLWVHGRWRRRVWCALALGPAPLAACLPLIRAARTYSGTFWARPAVSSLAEYAQFLLGPALLPLGILILAVGLNHFRPGIARRLSGDSGRGVLQMRIPAEEIAAVLLFLCLPIYTLVMALALTGGFTPRYALAGVLGVAVFCAWLAGTEFQARFRPGVLLACLVSLFFLARAAYDFRFAVRAADTRAAMVFFLNAQNPGEPIFIDDPQLFLELAYDAPAPLRARLRYFVDPGKALHYLGTDTVDRCLASIARLTPLRLERLEDWAASGRRIHIYGSPALWEWSVHEMAAQGVPMRIDGFYAGRMLLSAEFGHTNLAARGRSARTEHPQPEPPAPPMLLNELRAPVGQPFSLPDFRRRLLYASGTAGSNLGAAARN